MPINQGIEIKRNNSIIIENNILYVGGSGSGNYTKIQYAIDNASEGDTIFVYDDSSPYFENIIINKTINLIGENKNSTVIDGNNYGDVVFITANSVNISGFKIQNSGNVDRDAGIKIQSKNNMIFGNILSDNDEGIGISSTSRNTISGNNISNNDYGIRLFMISSNNIITENYIFSNKFRGIRLEKSYNNKIFDNFILNNGNGVRFEESENNNFSGNIVSNNGNGLDLISSINSTIIGNNFINDGLQIQDSYKNNITSNIVNGKPIVYLEEESDKIIDEAGQVLLVNCNNITIQNQFLSNVTYGILLWQTNNCLIKGNTLYSNDFDGILMHSSGDNTIIDNKIYNNDNGISLDYSGDNNKISYNKIENNSHGVHIFSSTSNTNISKNNFLNNLYGVQLYDSHDFIIASNNFTNHYFGVSLWQFSSKNDIFSNNFYDCTDAIWLNKVNDNLVLRNKIYRCEFNGIWLLESIHNRIKENTIIDCNCSVNLIGSLLNIIFDNNFVKGGIFSLNSFDNTVTNNIVNNKSLVYLEDTSDITVEDAGQVIIIKCENITVKNSYFFDLIIGIELLESDYCNIINNEILNNYYGSWIINSNNNTFSNNVISNYKEWGLYMESSDDNSISENNVIIDSKYDTCEFVLNNNKISILKHLLEDTDSYPLLSSNVVNNNQGLIFIDCNRNQVSNNNVSNNKDGIILKASYENIFNGNDIALNKGYGILMETCNNNQIIRNDIVKNNGYGIYLEESFFNKIKNNNFMENNQNAFFNASFFNRWVRNYWNEFRLLPKPIFGKIKIKSFFITWINIDWRPAKLPLIT
jgi:parallel beta-helix repeat protein